MGKRLQHRNPQHGRPMVLQQQHIRSGPLPAADEMVRYNDAHPGAAERILQMAEKEQEFAHRQARRAGWYKALSLVISSVLSLGVIALAFYMEYRNSSSTDAVVYSMAVLIGVAITGRVIVSRMGQGG